MGRYIHKEMSAYSDADLPQSQPMEATFIYDTKTEDVPYRKRMSVANEWTQIPTGDHTDPLCVRITNVSGQEYESRPDGEEVERHARRIVEISFGDVPQMELPPAAPGSRRMAATQTVFLSLGAQLYVRCKDHERQARIRVEVVGR